LLDIQYCFYFISVYREGLGEGDPVTVCREIEINSIGLASVLQNVGRGFTECDQLLQVVDVEKTCGGGVGARGQVFVKDVEEVNVAVIRTNNREGIFYVQDDIFKGSLVGLRCCFHEVVGFPERDFGVAGDGVSRVHDRLLRGEVQLSGTTGGPLPVSNTSGVAIGFTDSGGLVKEIALTSV